MADFLIAYKRTSRFEGGWANDPDDRGGETWKGIARNIDSHWKGWAIIDKYKGHSDFPHVLYSIPELETEVQNYYRINYWNPMWGDKIENQEVANSIYDKCVNLGVGTSIKMAHGDAGLEAHTVFTTALLNRLNNVV